MLHTCRWRFPLWRFPIIRGGNYFPFLNLQLAFARWTQAHRIEDGSLHGRVDDVRLADRAFEWMIEELKLDGAHGEIVAKKVPKREK